MLRRFTSKFLGWKRRHWRSAEILLNRALTVSCALAEENRLKGKLPCFEARQISQPFAHRAHCLLAGAMAVSAATYVPLIASTSDHGDSTLKISYFLQHSFSHRGQRLFCSGWSSNRSICQVNPALFRPATSIAAFQSELQAAGNNHK